MRMDVDIILTREQQLAAGNFQANEFSLPLCFTERDRRYDNGWGRQRQRERERERNGYIEWHGEARDGKEDEAKF